MTRRAGPPPAVGPPAQPASQSRSGADPATPVRARVAEIACVAGGGALVASAFVHWLRRGPGHSLRGHDLVDTVVSLGREIPGLTGARLTVLWYLVPAAGAAAWITCGLRGVGSRATRAVGLGATAVTALVVATFARLAGVGALGPGPYLALAGAVAVLAGSWTSARMSRPGP